MTNWQLLLQPREKTDLKFKKIHIIYVSSALFQMECPCYLYSRSVNLQFVKQESPFKYKWKSNCGIIIKGNDLAIYSIIQEEYITYYLKGSSSGIFNSLYGWVSYTRPMPLYTVQNLNKELHVLSLLSVPHDLFWPDLPKSLAKISQRPENRKDWSK